jgi:hypothetical protein
VNALCTYNINMTNLITSLNYGNWNLNFKAANINSLTEFHSIYIVIPVGLRCIIILGQHLCHSFISMPVRDTVQESLT